MQPVHYSLLDAKPYRLREVVLNGLIGWYGCYLRDKIPEPYKGYRENALAQLKK